MNNKVLCCLICVVVIIILVIMIFTHKNEHFNTVADAAGSQYLANYENNIPENITCIVSKIDGVLLNVNVLSSDSGTNNKTL